MQEDSFDPPEFSEQLSHAGNFYAQEGRIFGAYLAMGSTCKLGIP